MKKLVFIFLYTSILTILSAQPRTLYCPEASFSTTQPNIPLHLAGDNGYSLSNGRYLIDGATALSNTIGLVYTAHLSNYCSQSHWVKDKKALVFPTRLQNNVWKGDLVSGILIDSNFQGWLPRFSTTGIPVGFDKKSPQDTGEKFIAIFKERLLSNKNRLYEAYGSGYSVVHFDQNVIPVELREFAHNLFWHNDSTLVKYQDSAGNANLYPTDTIVLPTTDIKYVNDTISRIASNTCIYEYLNGNWDSLFVLDTSIHKEFHIQEFTDTRILIQNHHSEHYLELDYTGQTSWKGSSNGFDKLRTIPDTLFADFNGRYLTLIGGILHSNMGLTSEYYSNNGVPPSSIITSINNTVYSWAFDTIFARKDPLSLWKPWLHSPFEVKKLEYNDRGHLLMLTDTGYYEVNITSKASIFHRYPCQAKPTFAHYIKNGGFVMECAQGAYIQDTVDSQWKQLNGLQGIQTIVFAANRAVVIDKESIKYSLVDSFVFDSIELSSRGVQKPVHIKDLHEPTLLSVHETISEFLLYSGSEQLNIQFSFNALNQMEISNYPHFYWGYAPHSFLNHTVADTPGYEPFRVRDAVYNGYSLTTLTDVGLVRFDCSSGVSEQKASEIQLYPNPASRELHFDATYDFTIYDMQGRKVQTGHGTLANISTLNKGLYLIRLQSENSEVSGRFVKQ